MKKGSVMFKGADIAEKILLGIGTMLLITAIVASSFYVAWACVWAVKIMR